MKKLVIYIILLSGLLFTGCSKFLDVQPQGETTEGELFKTQKGFRDALTGAYIRMKGSDIYGGSLMWGTIEYMACNWDANPNNTAVPKLKAGTYTDETVRGWLDNIYANLYKVIADVDGILDNIEDKKSVFTDGNYAVVKGESLALRAFCHFDALRLFGPMPASPGTERILPYVKTVTKDIHEPVAYQEFAQSILADLDEAEALLKDVDPILKYSIAELNPVANSQAIFPDDNLNYRQVRMNYYAVLALKARVYLWLAPLDNANKLNAVKYAKMVIAGIDHNGAATFRLGKETDRAAEDYTMSPEHIMALSVYNLQSIANDNFGETGSLMRYDFAITDGFYYLNSLFPVAERTSDVRWKQMWNYKTSSGNTNYVMYKKFIQKATSPVLQVPLLRLSEMYLILTECAETKTEAETIYTTFCNSKGIPFTTFASGDWISDRRNKVIREYAREFYAEGQSFFTYKRLNVTTLPANWTYTYFTGTPAKYVVPKPLREINYNNK